MPYSYTAVNSVLQHIEHKQHAVCRDTIFQERLYAQEGYTDIWKELEIYNLNENIEDYREKWQKPKVMNADRIPVVNVYKATGRKDE